MAQSRGGSGSIAKSRFPQHPLFSTGFLLTGLGISNTSPPQGQESDAVAALHHGSWRCGTRASPASCHRPLPHSPTRRLRPIRAGPLGRDTIDAACYSGALPHRNLPGYKILSALGRGFTTRVGFVQHFLPRTSSAASCVARPSCITRGFKTVWRHYDFESPARGVSRPQYLIFVSLRVPSRQVTGKQKRHSSRHLRLHELSGFPLALLGPYAVLPFLLRRSRRLTHVHTTYLLRPSLIRITVEPCPIWCTCCVRHQPNSQRSRGTVFLGAYKEGICSLPLGLPLTVEKQQLQLCFLSLQILQPNSILLVQVPYQRPSILDKQRCLSTTRTATTSVRLLTTTLARLCLLGTTSRPANDGCWPSTTTLTPYSMTQLQLQLQLQLRRRLVTTVDNSLSHHRTRHLSVYPL